LGGGGFAKTYLAEDIDKLNEYCVVKQFAPQMQGTGPLRKAKELFEHEARQLQQLGEHPQIPTLFAYFEQDHCLYLVQQYIDGQNLLTELQRQGTFSEQKIRELLLDLLALLQEVHKQKVIHRDIKPENIIRRRDGKLVLIDFGASKQLTAKVINNPGTVIGSFGYAPLEQMQGGEAYPASDLYSLGVTCFYLLTGINPWELWKRQGYGWTTHWRQYLHQPVSQELGRIIDNMLKEDYQQRYHSATEVLQQLKPSFTPLSTSTQLLTNNKPSLSPTTPNQYQASRPSPQAKSLPVLETFPPSAVLKQKTRFNKKVLLGGALVLLVLVGTQIYSYTRYGLFPTNPIFAMIGLPGNAFLVRDLTGHSASVSFVTFSPDGNTLASASADKTIKLWNLGTGEQILTFKGHSDWVRSIAFSPDGNTLASAGYDKTIKLWNLTTQEEIRTLKGNFDSFSSVAFSPDGKTLASGSYDETIKLWDVATGEQIRTLKGHFHSVNSVAFSPDGNTLASGDGDNTIKLWNPTTGRQIHTLIGHSDLINSVAFSPDGKTLASGSFDKTIKLWDVATGEQIRTLKGHFNSVTSVAFNPDGKTLASGSFDETVKLWDITTGEQIRTLKGHSGWVNSVAFSPDGKTLASGSRDNLIKIWRIP
jgi:WD40 repeat protein